MLPSLTQLSTGARVARPTLWGELPTDIKRKIIEKAADLSTVEDAAISLCKTDKEFAALCREGGVWNALLTHFGWKPWVEAPNLDAEKAFRMLRNLKPEQQTYLSNWNEYTTTIDKNVFYNSSKLQLTTLPPNVTHIEWGAFQGCEKLALAALPETLDKIGLYAFSGCVSLRLTALPDTVTWIGSSAFYWCKNITLTALPAAITQINSLTFFGCEKLALTTLPVGLTYIGQNAFSGCHNLALTALPDALVSIGDRAFFGCTNLPPAVQTAIKNINPNAMEF